MEDFRAQLGEVIDSMLANGQKPVFLMCDLDGIDEMKRLHGVESLEQFHAAVIAALVSAARGADAFTYGESRIVAILDGSYDRLKTFSLIQKLRRVIPMLGQSFDCMLTPEFDAVEYNAATGVAGIINALAHRRTFEDQVA